METLLAIMVGCLTSAGLYLMLRRTFTRMLLGVLLLGQAANLLILTAGGIGPGIPAIIGKGETVLPSGHPDPLPQALILTAIVIGFAMVAFTVVLLKRARQELGTADFDTLENTEQ